MEEPKSSLKQRITGILKKYFTGIIGLIIGLVAGYLYYYYIGCSSGSCPITSNPWISMLWGGVIGYLLGDTFKPKPKNQQKENF